MSINLRFVMSDLKYWYIHSSKCHFWVTCKVIELQPVHKTHTFWACAAISHFLCCSLDDLRSW